jgi:hypothetical protein
MDEIRSLQLVDGIRGTMKESGNICRLTFHNMRYVCSQEVKKQRKETMDGVGAIRIILSPPSLIFGFRGASAPTFPGLVYCIFPIFQANREYAQILTLDT